MTSPALLHAQPIAVRWGDMDALGHVNNIVYLQYFEEGRVAWAGGLGAALDRTRAGMILARATLDYKRPLVWPTAVEVRHYAGPLGQRSFTLTAELVSPGDGTLWCAGEFVLVWFDYAAGKAVPVPQWLRDVLAPPALVRA